MEIVHQGWLIKSPPEKRIWRAKWRRRWFVLKHTGQIPGQYMLEYYTDPGCRKLKGKINLDQCEQVDAGISLESRKWNYQFTFDIRTPKRIYMLVAENEREMNKWVDCICTVCGLQIHSDDETNNGIDETSPSTEVSQSLPVLTTQESAQQNGSFQDLSESPSSGYIPISECISGKIPVFLEDDDRYVSDLDYAPPAPSKLRFNRTTSESYDIPRQVCPPHSNGADSDVNAENCSGFTDRNDTTGESFSAPKVNWDTYPKDSDSIDTYSSLFPKNTNSLTKPNVAKGFGRVHIGNGNSGYNGQELYENLSFQLETNLENQLVINGTAPPRPPKPAHLVEPSQCYQNISLQTKVLPSSFNGRSYAAGYDVPPPVDSSSARNLLSPQSTCSYSSSGSSMSKLDEMYDIPRCMPENALNAMPPVPHGSLMKGTRHAYGNAPPGYLNDNVFNYDSNVGNTISENYLCMDAEKPFKTPEVYTDMSVENKSPSSVYSNLPSPVNPLSQVPPLVNRNLKPKKNSMELKIAHSRSCSSASSTDISAKSPSPNELTSPPVVNRGLKPKVAKEVPEKPNILALDPPPVRRIRIAKTKQSFRKMRGTFKPSLPSPNLNSAPSSSDEDISSAEHSRRNSANEDQKMFPLSQSTIRNESDIQYLDLDLESDPIPKSPGRTSTSTVYKTVDFVKTKAFIKMRQNVEETYRKSQ